MENEDRENNRNLATSIFNCIMSAYSLNRVSGLPMGIEFYGIVGENFKRLRNSAPELAKSLSIFYDTLQEESR